jgi:hypothetical protein
MLFTNALPYKKFDPLGKRVKGRIRFGLSLKIK